jgi:formylglycine-generating enzyme required for sulfatase activity
MSDSHSNSIGFSLVKIEPGEFIMGSPEDEQGRYVDERRHRVKITQAFYMGASVVTQAQWRQVMGTEPWLQLFEKEGDDYPAIAVSWNDANEFCQKVSEKENRSYRLPTEAEWEYACRAGSVTRFCFGEDDEALDGCAWYFDNSGRKLHPVAQKAANDWGLYDMHGCVWEWCDDCFGEYPQGEVTDPSGPWEGTNRVLRGGSWFNEASFCRSAQRDEGVEDDRDYFVGFRVVMDG